MVTSLRCQTCTDIVLVSPQDPFEAVSFDPNNGVVRPIKIVNGHHYSVRRSTRGATGYLKGVLMIFRILFKVSTDTYDGPPKTLKRVR